MAGISEIYRNVLGSDLSQCVENSKVLVVGAGGIGCELLKNLVLTGFKDIEVVSIQINRTRGPADKKRACNHVHFPLLQIHCKKSRYIFIDVLLKTSYSIKNLHYIQLLLHCLRSQAAFVVYENFNRAMLYFPCIIFQFRFIFQ